MIFLRHPVTAAAPGLCYGRLDVDLSEDARDQIMAVLDQLEPQRTIISSPARRCTTLATAIAQRDGAAVTQDTRLQELNFGAWEGRGWSDLPRDETDRWAADPWDIAPPGGEAFSEMYARVNEALSSCPHDALIVTHAGVVRAARMILSGVSFNAVFAENVPHCVPIALERRSA